MVSSGFDYNRPPIFAIDGLLSSCTSVIGEGTRWLRVALQTTQYIREVTVLFYQGKGKDVVVFIGRGLRQNGRLGNTPCHAVSSGVNGSEWVRFTCHLPVLGQFIYIEKQTSSIQICEIKLSYGNRLLTFNFHKVSYFKCFCLLS